jgi:hypothetical protein
MNIVLKDKFYINLSFSNTTAGLNFAKFSIIIVYVTIFVIDDGIVFKTEEFQVSTVMCWCTESKERCARWLVIRYR